MPWCSAVRCRWPHAAAAAVVVVVDGGDETDDGRGGDSDGHCGDDVTCALDELQKPDAAVGGDAVGGEAHKVRRCCCCSALWLEWRWWRRRPGWATDCSCDSALGADAVVAAALVALLVASDRCWTLLSDAERAAAAVAAAGVADVVAGEQRTEEAAPYASVAAYEWPIAVAVAAAVDNDADD